MIAEILKAILYGIVEGVTEWLPISSTGHLILLKALVPLNVSDGFWNLFEVVIQLGAILAVILLFWGKLWPFGSGKSVTQKRYTWQLWFHVAVGVLPSVVFGLVLNDLLPDGPMVVAAMLILYGAAFLLVERRGKKPTIRRTEQITYRTALFIGLFQVLSMVPGTSRSGVTILGAMLLGLSRTAASEFSFFLAIPTMAGASLLKTVKFVSGGLSMTSTEVWVLIVGCLAAFLVSLAAIRGLMQYVKKHSFSAFGIYRIVLGVVVLVYGLLGK